MLVLRRKSEEAIVLSQVITVRVLAIEGDRVKLGIDAPPDVIVVREELLDDHSGRHLPPTQRPGRPPAAFGCSPGKSGA